MTYLLAVGIETFDRPTSPPASLPQELLEAYDRLLERATGAHRGHVVERWGFRRLLNFPDSGSLLSCAIEIQHRAAKLAKEHEDFGLCVATHYADHPFAGSQGFAPARHYAEVLLDTCPGAQVLITPQVLTLCSLPPEAGIEDLGIHQLRDLSEPRRLYRLTHPSLERDTPVELRSLSTHPNNLPVQAIPLIGRQAEQRALIEHILDKSYRLLTLVGPGGVGKTRLALHVAAATLEGFADGVYFVPLAPLNRANFIVSTIAKTINFTPFGSEKAENQLRNYLLNKEMLIILDSVEHLTTTSPLLEYLSTNCPGLTLLSTSRVPLRLTDEYIVPLRGLRYPSDEEPLDLKTHDAVQLFLFNARRLDPDFTANGDELTQIVRICRLVEGLPLSLTLAATWIPTLSAGEIAEEIENYLDFLATSVRDLPSRHRSLRAVFDSSWKLLSEEEKEALQSLTVFRGGFRAEAAAAVGGISPKLLTRLVSQSLLSYEKEKQRYQLPLALRQYAEEQLELAWGDDDEQRDRHSEYYTRLLKGLQKNFKGYGQTEALTLVEEEIENVRLAWAWAIKRQDVDSLNRAMETLARFYSLRNWLEEAQDIFFKAISALIVLEGVPGTPIPHLLARLESRLSWTFMKMGRYDEARSAIEAAIEHLTPFDDPGELALILHNQGYIAYRLGEYLKARQLFERSIELYRSIDEPLGLLRALNGLSSVLAGLGEYAQSERVREESLALSEAVGYRSGMASILNNLGNSALNKGEYERAYEIYERSLALQYESGNKRSAGSALSSLGNVAYLQGKFEEAHRCYEECLKLYDDCGHRWGVAYVKLQMGYLLQAEGHCEAARSSCQEGLVLAEQMHNRWGMAYAHLCLGTVAASGENLTQTLEHFRASLEIAGEMQTPPLLLKIVEHVARTWFDTRREDRGRALAWARFVAEHPVTAHRVRENAQQLIAEALTSAGTSAAEGTPPYRELDEVVDEILTEIANAQP